MLTLLNCNQILYAHLSGGKLSQALGGGIYTADTRPLDDEQEALVIQTIALQAGTPQAAKASLSLYVPDILIERGKPARAERVADLGRLSELSALLAQDLQELQMQGVLAVAERELLFDIPSIKQHALSYELHWNIHS